MCSQKGIELTKTVEIVLKYQQNNNSIDKIYLNEAKQTGQVKTNSQGTSTTADSRPAKSKKNKSDKKKAKPKEGSQP